MIRGIPLSQVKHARFITRVGDIFTILRIIKNGLVYDITSTASSGSVSVGGNYLSWAFTAPDERFDFDAMGSGTVGQLLDGIMAVCAVDPVEEWENYAQWTESQDIVDAINSIGVDLAQIRVLGHTGTPVPFSAVSTFNGILQWVKSNCPAGALALPAFSCRTAENEFSVALTGLDAGGEELWTMTFVFRQ